MSATTCVVSQGPALTTTIGTHMNVCYDWCRVSGSCTDHHHWNTHECLLRLVSCLRGPALTAHRSFSLTKSNDYALCIVAFHNRIGNHIPVVTMTLRAELSALCQEEGESLDMFGDCVCALTAQAYPDMEDMSAQSLAVPTFLNGIRDRDAAQEAKKFANPESIQEAMGQVRCVVCIQ